jgi:prophage DNA circulation protein
VAEYDTYDAAVSVRDDLAAKIDEQAQAADDDTFAALAQLRADLVRSVPGEERDLPRLVRHTPEYTVPSLVLAHRLYGSLERESDLVTRNRIPRPGFILGGVGLEVLADA